LVGILVSLDVLLTVLVARKEGATCNPLIVPIFGARDGTKTQPFLIFRLAAVQSVAALSRAQEDGPEDEGIGLIWRLSSITGLEERDGGVYAELEAIALSRDIPTAVRRQAKAVKY
jgi:hypothetical protein